MRIVSFATPGPYEAELAELKRSAEKFDLEVHSEIVTNVKGWHEAVCFKPTFIFQRLTCLGDGESLLWLDADARVVARPNFSALSDAFFAAHRHRWSIRHSWEMLTGTLFFRKTRDVVNLVLEWMFFTEKWRKLNRDTPDQYSLAEAYDSFAARVMCYELGPELCWIEGEHFASLHPGKKPAILHTQASRRYRR